VTAIPFQPASIIVVHTFTVKASRRELKITGTPLDGRFCAVGRNTK